MSEVMPDTEAYLAANPFGTEVQASEIVENFAFFDDWEDRYRFILDLSKQLPEMPDALKAPEHIIHGCQSQVWITHHSRDGRLYFVLDSDAHIVRGLIAIVLSALNARPAADILKADVDDLFAELDLIRHLSPTRGNGLRAMVARIRKIAATECEAH